jgi:hypothetical protein
MGAVPGWSSITNSTSQSGGIPGNSSGKTSGILTNYWNFIKMRDNGHIGTRVCTILER